MTEELRLVLNLPLPQWKPEYDSRISQKAWENRVSIIQQHVHQSIDLLNGYWRTNNEVLLNMMIEELYKAYKALDILYLVMSGDDKQKMIALTTFLWHLAGGLHE